jgi:type VI secretion system protein ImpM
LNELANIPGFYGKIPVRGDFVVRNLTPRFIEIWDKWLQSALSASKEQLGAQWLEIYLTSPIWRFMLSPGICGSNPWAGILMPSVDKVGRYFPLTIAVAIDPALSLTEQFIGAADWFKRMEQLALSALEDNLELAELESKLHTCTLSRPSPLVLENGNTFNYTNAEGRLAFHMSINKLDHMADAFVQLGFRILTDAHPTYSLWSTAGSDSMRPCLRVYDNLPPCDAYYELLIGQEDQLADDTDAPESPPFADQDCMTETSGQTTDCTIENQHIQWRSFGATTIGKKRRINEDAFLEYPEIGLWAVADGMGGHSAGDVASKTVIDALGTLAATGNLESYTAYTTECLRTVNANLLDMADKIGDGRIIGSTVVVMLAVGTRCAAIWAGDSRLYQLRDGQLTQLTNDHSLVTELSQQGIIAADEPQAEKMENIVTRALGAEPELSFDVINFEARDNDLYLLCSDGLIKEVHPNEIADIMKKDKWRMSTQNLIDLALERGARDNVTVVVAGASQTESRQGITGFVPAAAPNLGLE